LSEPQYSVSLSSTTIKYFNRCDVPTRGRLREKFEKLKADPFDLRNSKPLTGRHDQRSARVGDLRVLFRVHDRDTIVAEIGPRGDIYKR
jgi:mRNA-degrading endonuclease RelE of RelBE toxin-antitoxin system